ncbi:MAG: hypothetical protein Q4F05_04585 [bacterium]|nr:hypothetical protein [bacterium]
MSWLSQLIDDNYDELVKILDQHLEKAELEVFPDELLEDFVLKKAKEEDRSVEEQIAEDYYKLLLHLYKEKRPNQFKLDREDYLIVELDGIRYELTSYITHDDIELTECLMEIETLFADNVSIEIVEQEVCKYIDER